MWCGSNSQNGDIGGDGSVTIEDLSTDAIQDEKRGLIYQARVKLNAQAIIAGGRTVPLGSGMQVSAEIKTGERRLIDYILSPIIKYRDESFRER